jgi:asparagine synthase (glutamine-hydrolysing)
MSGMSLVPVLDHVRSVLRGAVLRAAEPAGPLRILFSGGLDSSLLGWVLRDRPATSLFVVGRPGAPDLRTAARSAPLVGLPLERREMSDENLAECWATFPARLGDVREPRRSVLFALHVALGSSHGGRALIGQGADELFGGYARFHGQTPEQAEALASDALHWPATLELASLHGVDLRAPYLDPDLRRSVLALPPHVRFSAVERKGALRTIARSEGLPAEIVEEPKRAMQYGTRFSAYVRDAGPDGGT